jgi:RNA polymerase sigma-70 factor, ECF subfamily
MPTFAPGADVNPDLALIERARAFDAQALSEIYDAYFERLYRYAYRFVGGVESAQDIASEALRRLLEEFRAGRAPDHLGAWLYGVTFHLAVDQHRRRPPGKVVSLDADLEWPDDATTESDAERSVVQARVRAALDDLTPEQRNVVVLKFLEGYSNSQVSALMNKPEGAIKSLQHRALAALRRALGYAD